MKHAEKLHDGKGAYQCQYCRKFFLRLNYLEMHRTYGCNANPQRARPLCDFCGRKFCQPQKLKVHIKRMHSGKFYFTSSFYCIFTLSLVDVTLRKKIFSSSLSFQTWLKCCETFNVNYVQNFQDHVQLCNDTRRKYIVAILQLLVVHDAKNYFRIEAI